MFPTKKKSQPTVCIKRTKNYTYCGREVDDNEIIFTDAAYAVQHYSASNTLRTCPECAAQWGPTAKKSILDMTPRATRGVNDR